MSCGTQRAGNSTPALWASCFSREAEKGRHLRKSDGSPKNKSWTSRIFVEDEAYNLRCPPSGEWWDYDRPTFVLDRREFETVGKADRSSEGWWDHCTYYADPALFHAERGRSARPACFQALDLPADATIAQVKAAFRRLSRSMHPDAGGTDHDFVRMRQSYEEALKLAAGRK